ncbi:MAG: class I SAM-dependent methyltransferase [Patescibacteria group bacterium]
MTPLPESVLDNLLSFSWAVPSDVILRATEAIEWSSHSFTSPVLDIGCGEGNIGAVVFFNQGKIDIGMDLDPDGIVRAKKSKKYKKLIVGDARKIPLPNSSVNTVISNSTFEHIEVSDIKAVSEVSRVLRSGGKFFITVPSDRYRDTLSGLVSPKEFTWYNDRVMHYRYRDLSDWQKILKKNNLKIIHHHYYFSKSIIPVWYRLFKIAVTKINGRELWSYIRDSRFSKFLPKKIIIQLEKIILRPLITQATKSDGTWHFIIAQKS